MDKQQEYEAIKLMNKSEGWQIVKRELSNELNSIQHKLLHTTFATLEEFLELQIRGRALKSVLDKYDRK